MRKTSLVLCSMGIGIVGLPAFAQDMPPDTGQESAPPEKPSPVTLTPDQQLTYGTWSADQQAQYDAWPGDVQAYYWTLSPPRQEAFWRLSDNDKMAVTAMGEPDREAAWQMLEQRMAAPQPPVAEEPALPGDKGE